MTKKKQPQMTYSQKKREKLDYRHEYFKRNPGLFGKVYFCAYCKRPLLRKDVQVDHIIPLNSHLGRNKAYNLVAACGPCNLAKSDKKDLRILLGYSSKAVDTVMYKAQDGVAAVVLVSGNIISWILFKSPLIIRLFIWAVILISLFSLVGGKNV